MRRAWWQPGAPTDAAYFNMSMKYPWPVVGKRRSWADGEQASRRAVKGSSSVVLHVRAARPACVCQRRLEKEAFAQLLPQTQEGPASRCLTHCPPLCVTASAERGGGSAEAWRMLEMCIFKRTRTVFRKCLCLRQNLHPSSSLLNGYGWVGILIPVRIAVLILYDPGSIHKVLKSILINISSVSLRALSTQRCNVLCC